MADTTSRGPTAINCIVDDSALLGGLGEDTKEDLKLWVRNGAVNLFVPLYTLEKLNQMRSSPPPLNLAARTALEWLDEITSSTEGRPFGRVELQGADDQYQTWKEVERYLLPDTPLSSGNLDGVAEDLQERLTLQDGNRKGATALRDASESSASLTPESSPEPSNATLARTNGNKSHVNFAETNGIPSPVRPLLNFVVWRTYHTDSTIAGSGKYILLTNDRVTQKQAQKFGVRAKLLPQVSSIVSKTPPNTLPNGGTEKIDKPIEPREAADERDEEEIVFNPALRPGSSRGKQLTPPVVLSSAKVLDPDAFGRTPGAAPAPVRSPQPATFQPAMHNHANGKPSPRGRGFAQLHQGPRIPSGPAAGRGGPQNGFRGGRGRGGFGRGGPHFNGRGGFQPGIANGGPAQHQVADKPIDPDSYARPPTRGGRGGSVRRLWNPNT